MSYNRENVTFQSEDGKWNIGFFSFYETVSYMDEDFDSEWDVEYNYDSFWWASKRHNTPEEAYQAYTRNHGNPSGTSIIAYNGNETLCETYLSYANALFNSKQTVS